MLAGVGQRPEAIWVVGALALRHRHGLGVAGHRDRRLRRRGAAARRNRAPRSARAWRSTARRWSLSGGVAITLAARIGWPAVNALLAIVYLPMLLLTWKSPEPEVQPPPPQTLRDAVWQPFLGFLAPATRARDPGVRRALQVRRSAHAVADAAVPHRHGLQRRSSRHRARDGRASSRRSPARSSAAG